MLEPEQAAPSVLTLGAGLAAAEPGETGPAAPSAGAAAAVVHYHLPVEIEVRAVAEPVDVDAVARQALLGLARGLANT